MESFAALSSRLKVVPKPAPRTPQAKENASRSVSGTFSTHAQIHMYLETKSVCVQPGDGGRMEVFVSGQCRDLEQSAVCVALGLPRNKVNMKNIRLGGGFGGKIFWQLPSLCAVAVASNKLNRTVRLQNERSDDMQMTGLRNPFDFKYDATFDDSGNLNTLDCTISTETGWITSLSPLFTDMAGGDMDNVFHWAGGLSYKKDMVLVNKAVNTPMRAPGTMQSGLVSLCVMDHIAKTLNKDLDELIEQNFYKVGDVTPFGDHIGSDKYNWTVPELWSQIQKDADYANRKQAVAEYNNSNRWTKKGIALTACKWTYKANQWNQGCIINAYVDGTVYVITNGTEMGQGLNTKVAMCVAQTLGIDMSNVIVEGGDTNSAGNCAVTGGSGTSESCCNGAIEAAKKLKGQLQTYLDAKKGSWQEAVAAAKMAGANMMATAWFQGHAFWDPTRDGGSPSSSTYSAYGVAVTEVMIDMLTGESRMERVDLLMDLGTQLNAAVDIGQVQGAFIKSCGYLFTEEVKWNDAGKQLHLGTWEYKLPTAYDIPVVFNTSLLKDHPNPSATAGGSKAVAEAAMSLASSPYLAVKNAIYAARQALGHKDEFFMLNCPVSPEAIQQAIGVPADHMTLPQKSH
jgi:xanthine dehydrogenase molybdopterin-binding subunit B